MGRFCCVDLRQRQCVDVDLIAQTTVSSAQDQCKVLKTHGLSNDRHSCNGGAFGELPLPLLRFVIPDQFAAFLPLTITHDWLWLRRGGKC
jgi:hypothetical protein